VSNDENNNNTLKYLGICVAAFLLIGFVVGPASMQMYSGVSAVGNDQITLENTGNLATSVQKLELQPSILPIDYVCGKFDGEDDYVSVGRLDSLMETSDEFTVTFNFNTVSDREDITCKWGGIGYRSWAIYSDGGRIGVMVSADGDTWSTVFSDYACIGINEDVEVSVVYDHGLVSYYFDDEYDSTDNSTEMTLFDSTTSVRIGSGYIKGCSVAGFHDIMYYNRALSDTEIRSDSVITGSLISHYLDGTQTSGLTLCDVTGNGYDAVVHANEMEFWSGSFIKNQRSDTIRPGIQAGTSRLEYTDLLDADSTFEYSKGRAYMDSLDVTRDISGTIPVISPGYAQTLKVDHGLDYSIEYTPLSMKVETASDLVPGMTMNVVTKLIDTSGSDWDSQPMEMRVRMFDGNDVLIMDEEKGSTSFAIPGEKLGSGHRQLRLSYYGSEFDGWSNEIIVDFDLGGEGLFITTDTGSAPDNAGTIIEKAKGLLYLSLDNWSDANIPLLPGFADWLIITLGLV
jgi:hypothetical protein